MPHDGACRTRQKVDTALEGCVREKNSLVELTMDWWATETRQERLPEGFLGRFVVF